MYDITDLFDEKKQKEKTDDTMLWDRIKRESSLWDTKRQIERYEELTAQQPPKPRQS